MNKNLFLKKDEIYNVHNYVRQKKNSGSIRQFPLTFTQQNDLFTLQEHKFNFSGKRGSMTSTA